jgi:hypothetical protein
MRNGAMGNDDGDARGRVAGPPESRLVGEHRDLDARFRALLDLLADPGASRDRAHAWFRELREAVEAHVDREDRLYYPALRALRPRHAAATLALASAHEGFRAGLVALDADFARGALAASARELRHFAGEFGAHEQEEERLLGEIERELGIR